LTGDICIQTEDGYLYHLSRSDDAVIVDRINVYPLEVENVIRTVEGVKDVAVIGDVDSELGTSLIKAFVVATDLSKKDNLLQDIHKACADLLDVRKRPKRVEFLEELPRSLRGKVQRFKLRN